MLEVDNSAEINYLGSNTPLWSLTIASFLKFQLKRKPMGHSGVANFQKQILKLLVDSEIEKNSEVLDNIIAWCVRTGKSELSTYQDYPEEAHTSVLADLMSAFIEIREKFLIS